MGRPETKKYLIGNRDHPYVILVGGFFLYQVDWPERIKPKIQYGEG